MKTITEAAFQKQVIQAARLYGWTPITFEKRLCRRRNGTCYWETPFGADGVGFPDLLLFRGAQVIAPELKVGRNKLSPEQDAWRERIDKTSIVHCVWRPEMWQEIEEVLSR